MRMPDGWIFIPRAKNGITFTLEQRELITCARCARAHAEMIRGAVVWRCPLRELDVQEDYWCADAMKEDSDESDDL